jgi:hypothetical protein
VRDAAEHALELVEADRFGAKLTQDPDLPLVSDSCEHLAHVAADLGGERYLEGAFLWTGHLVAKGSDHA